MLTLLLTGGWVHDNASELAGARVDRFSMIAKAFGENMETFPKGTV